MNVKRKLLVVGALPIVLCLVVLISGLTGIRLNIASNSLPPGLYRIVQAGQGNDVLFCPTGMVEKITIEREFRTHSYGCGDGYAPMLKPIVARAGDIVSIGDAGVSVNGRLLPNSKQVSKDGRGRLLPLVPHGLYTVEPGTAWVVSSYNRYSFDSRYFGAIRLEGKVRYAKPFILF